MPKSINGCGTMYCGYSAPIYWAPTGSFPTQQAEHDAFVCVTFLMFPLVPLRACHVYDHVGDVCRELELKWNRDLMLRTFLRPWLFVAIAIGLFVAPMTAIAAFVFVYAPSPTQSIKGLLLMFAISLLAPIGFLVKGWLNRVDRRNRDIRLIMGRHVFGSSDPATWSPLVLKNIDFATLFPDQHDTADFVNTALAALREKNYPKAMLAARFAVARGQILDGEAITDRILTDPVIETFIEALRLEPWRRDEWLSDHDLQSSAAPQPPTLQCSLSRKEVDTESGTVFYDSRLYSNEVLDAVGGEGYANFVRANPALSRSARVHWLPQVMKAVFGAMGLSAAMYALFVPMPDRWNAVLGGLMLAAANIFFFRESLTQRVFLRNGRIWVGAIRGNETLLDAVTSIGRRRWLFLFPVVSVKTLASEINWPCHGRDIDDIERAIAYAIQLRNAAIVQPGAVTAANQMQ